MYYVYLLRSRSHPEQTYIGFTRDLKTRLRDHNAQRSFHTAKYIPWDIVSYHAFADQTQAAAFEQYLKTGSGQAFAKRRLWSPQISL